MQGQVLFKKNPENKKKQVTNEQNKNHKKSPQNLPFLS